MARKAGMEERGTVSRRRRLLIVGGLLLLVVLLLVALLWRPFKDGVPVRYQDDTEHFKYGSIGSEASSGIPYWAWQALPRLFPEDFAGRSDYKAFGFLYERDKNGRQLDLPIGISRRNYQGIDMVWFNCAVCHVGTWRTDAAGQPQIVPGMPSNNLEFGGFITFLLGKAALDPRMNPKGQVWGAQQAGAGFGPVRRLFWGNIVAPRLREGLINQRSMLLPLVDWQSPWGQGRVDTFNPYKLLKFEIPFDQLADSERVGTSDFPAIFHQRPREGMELHWDGNNKSLMERNLSAAIGAGVTPKTVDIPALQRVANWLKDLKPPPSPIRPDPAAVARGSGIYGQACAACHGHQQGANFVFSGQWLGKVTPIEAVGTDRNRLDSYTQRFRDRQVSEIFRGTPYAFRNFTKTNGYANQPLDGLWLRAPYLHNGSVPTLAALLDPPERRPVTYVRGLDIVDHQNGGFVAPGCDPAARRPLPRAPVGQRLLCFDTRIRGNGNGGHLWGTGLAPDAKADLLAYLKTF